MQTRLKALTEDTLLPIGFVIVLFGAVSWITSLYNETRANTNAIKDLNQEQRLYNDKLDRIILKLSHIEGKLGMN
jgi:hypothetical protein